MTMNLNSEKPANETVEEQDDVMAAHDTDQYLTFVMDEEEYGVDILSVQEIRGWEKTTSIPNSPDYLKGVINLRGTIVPIIDLRLRFGMPAIEYTPVTVVIVLKLPFEGGQRTVGIVVDTVSSVHGIDQKDIRANPDIRNRQNTESTLKQNKQYIRGLADVNGTMVIILELQNLLDEDELPDES